MEHTYPEHREAVRVRRESQKSQSQISILTDSITEHAARYSVEHSSGPCTQKIIPDTKKTTVRDNSCIYPSFIFHEIYIYIFIIMVWGVRWLSG